MSIPTAPSPALLVMSIIFSPDSSGALAPSLACQQALDRLQAAYGPLAGQGPIAKFRQTAYYDREMGSGLLRQFVCFAGLVRREQLATIKLFTNTVEQELAGTDGRRRVNLDPGLLSVENLVLATGKNFTHRLYLHDGIFAEVTLIFQGGRFQSLPWTYWDYAADEVVSLLTGWRQELLGRLRAGESLPPASRS